MSEEQINNLLDEFNYKLTKTHLGEHIFSREDLLVLLNRILSAISIDYSTYRKYVPSLLYILEKNDMSSIIVLIDTYFINYYELIKVRDFSKIDSSLYNQDLDEQTVELYKTVFRNSISYEQKIRISDFILDKSIISQEEKLKFICLLITTIQEFAKENVWDNNTVQALAFDLPALRDLLNDQNDFCTFYFIVGIVMDRFGSSEYFQQSRDLAEELILSSYNDNCPYWGFFNSFRCYSNSSTVIPSLLYANLSFINALNSKNTFCQKYIVEIIWQGVKLFRNASLYDLVEEIFKSIPSHLDFDDYEYRSIAHSYFLSLLKRMDPKVPEIVLDFLNEHREIIFKTGISDAMPWLVTLYNIKRIYSSADFSQTGLGYYISVFEMIVPAELVSNYKAIINGDSIVLKQLLRKSLIKLNETRNIDDFTSDNEVALTIAGRMIGQAVELNDYESLLLAMMVKADFSYIFTEKKKEELTTLTIPHDDIESFNNIYGAESQTIIRFNEMQGYKFIWLIVAEYDVYLLQSIDGEFSCAILKEWNYEKFIELKNAGFFSQIFFDDTKKTTYEVRTLLPEEHIEASNNLITNFSFARIIDKEKENYPLLIVLDMNLSEFPHNLFLDADGVLLMLNHPICNILSTEWYLKYANKVQLNNAGSKSIWIPIDGGDFTIIQLHEKIKETLANFNFSTITSVEPKSLISSDINIIAAHGLNDIALTQIVFPDDTKSINISKYLGSGKILIFLVCHSGSIKSTPFKNSISTIVKQFIVQGYYSVIAPFWSLEISVVSIWLPKFLNSFQSGKQIVEAVHDANLEVFNKHPAISAYACMHLYGDPHLSIK